ncbi:MAG: TonB-dependent receptor [Bacteroidota bacterium]
MKTSFPYFPLLFVLLACGIIQAQVSPTDSITNLDEVILLENLIQKKASGITPSSEIGIAELEQFGPADFASGLNQVSGVYLLSGALNTNRITIRGVGARTPFSTDKLRMYFNGIPITNGTGVSTIEAFDFENLGNIEVVKGPKGVTLGTNLGGAIVLSTRPPQVGKTFLSNRFTVGSFNQVKNNVSFRHSERNFNISLSYNHFSTDGFRQNNSFDRDGVLLTAAIRISPKSKLDLLVNHIDYNAGIPSSLNETDFRENPRLAAANWLAARGFEDNRYTLTGLSHTYDFSPNFQNTTSVFYTYLDHYEPRPFNILDEYTSGFGIRSIFKGTLGPGEFSFGTELYKDEYHWSTFRNQFRDNDGNGSLQGERLSRNKEFRDLWNVFGQYVLPLGERFTLQAGLAWNQTQFDFRDLFNQGEANTSAERGFDSIFLPSFGARYTLNKGMLFAHVARGFSNPGLEETLTPDGVINPEIAQENGTSYEIGGRFSFFDNRLRITSVLYRMNIEDLLVSRRTAEDQFIGINAGETRHQGWELDVRYRFKLAQNFWAGPYLSYTLNDHSFVEFVDGDDDFSGNALTGVPKNRIQSGVLLGNNKGFRFAFNHQYVDAIPLNDASTLQSESFNVFRCNVRYAFDVLPNLNAGLNLGVNNVFDTSYAQSVLINAVGFGGNAPRFFYPGEGRNWYAGLRLQYDL